MHDVSLYLKSVKRMLSPEKIKGYFFIIYNEIL